MSAEEWVRCWREVLAPRNDREERLASQAVSAYRAGRLTDLRLQPGRLTARVQGASATPYLVDIDVPRLAEHDWTVVVERIAGQVRHSAQLLIGRHPDGLLDDLSADGVALLPTRDELDITSAGDELTAYGQGVAVWEAAAETLAADPFMVFRLRGRGRERLLREVSRARGGGDVGEAQGVPLDALDADGWTRAPVHPHDVHLPRLVRRDPAAQIRLAGELPSWQGAVSAADLLGPPAAQAAGRAAELLADD